MSLKTAGSSENRTTLESGGSANAPYEKEKINLHDQRSFTLYPKFFPSRGSITAKLTFLFSLSALVIFGLAAIFFNWVIERNLHKEDNQFLADKIRVLRRILQERPDDTDFLKAEAEWEAAARQFIQYYVRVVDLKEKTVIETSGMGGLVPTDVFPPAVLSTRMPQEATEWRSENGQLYLLMSAWAEVGRAGDRRLIQVAMNESTKKTLWPIIS